MDVQIRNILRHIKDPISLMQTVFEAITNSFDAHADNIVISFMEKASLDVGLRTIDSYTIEDNGDGFGEKNIASFSEYLTSYKYELGCKGVGRFTWLKVFDNVTIESQLENEYVKIKFDRDYDKEKSVKVITQTIGKKYTKLTFSGLLDFKQNATDLDLPKIKDDILSHFIPKFSIRKFDKSPFQITLIDEVKNERLYITLDDILPTQKTKFSIVGSDNYKATFSLLYNFFDAPQSTTSAQLCANKRVVRPIKEYSNLSLPNQKSGIFLVFSKYLDDRVSEGRTDFTLDKSTDYETLNDPITYKKIVQRASNEIDGLILKEFPQLEDKNRDVIQKCSTEYPFLQKYIIEDDSLIKREEKVIKVAEQKYSKEKESIKQQFQKMLESAKLDPKKFDEMLEKLSDISNRELAQYFVYRQQIIDGLHKFSDDKVSLEELLHNLFMKKGTSSANNNYESCYSNNIWLLDDKFMSYSNMFSDKTVDSIINEIQAKNDSSGKNQERPDLTVFFSNKTLVIVEFKGVGAKSQEKLSAISEIDRNIGIVARNFDNVNSIYGFVITGFDDQLVEYIGHVHGVTTMFTNSSDPLFYYHNDNIVDRQVNRVPTHVFITSTHTIWADANERNKLFLEIIKNK